MAKRSFVGWMFAHPWMTLFLGAGVIGIPVGIAQALKSKSNTPGGAGLAGGVSGNGGLPNGGTTGGNIGGVSGGSGGALASFPAGSVGVDAGSDGGKTVTLPPGGDVVVLLPSGVLWADATPASSVLGAPSRQVLTGRTVLVYPATGAGQVVVFLNSHGVSGQLIQSVQFTVKVVVGASPSIA